MNLRFAFAVNNENQFEDCYFGDADKFLIYQVVSDGLKLIHAIPNNFESKINSPNRFEKVDALIKNLLGNDIKVMVSKQFGENIKIVNEYFIPVKISSETPFEAADIINGHLHWIEDELKNSNSGYKLFTINSGILKSSIDE